MTSIRTKYAVWRFKATTSLSWKEIDKRCTVRAMRARKGDTIRILLEMAEYAGVLYEGSIDRG